MALRRRASSKGYTAAHYAAYAGSQEILELLFEKGWSPDAKNFTLTTVRQTASDYGQNEALAVWIGKCVSKARRKEEQAEALESSSASSRIDNYAHIESNKVEEKKIYWRTAITHSPHNSNSFRFSQLFTFNTL